MSKALTFSAGGAIHCIKTTGAGIALRGAKVTVRCYLDGRMDVLFKDRILPYTTVRKLPRASQIEDDKTVDARLDEIITRTRRRHPSPGSVDGSGYGGPDPTTAPPSTPTSTKPSTLGGDIYLAGKGDISTLGQQRAGSRCGHAIPMVDRQNGATRDGRLRRTQGRHHHGGD